MAYVTIVTVLLLLQAIFFGIHVGQMRGKHDVKAPAMDGPDEFMRSFRVHQNTNEQLIVLLPAMWMSAWMLHELAAAVLGLVFLVGRFLYRASYLRDPSSRDIGFVTGFIATALLLIGALVGAVLQLL